MRKLEISTGDIFGNLQVISEIDKIGNMRVFNVICNNCGINKRIRLNGLLRNKTGCKCVHKKHNVKRVSIEWKKLRHIFKAIINRCNNPKNKQYNLYGGRGIKCEWGKFEEFYNDMIDSYKEGLCIDRINNNGNYSKENCRWITNSENQNNKRNNIIVEGGLTLSQWCRINGYTTKSQYNHVRYFLKKKNKLPEKNL